MSTSQNPSGGAYSSSGHNAGVHPRLDHLEISHGYSPSSCRFPKTSTYDWLRQRVGFWCYLLVDQASQCAACSTSLLRECLVSSPLLNFTSILMTIPETSSMSFTLPYSHIREPHVPGCCTACCYLCSRRSVLMTLRDGPPQRPIRAVHAITYHESPRHGSAQDLREDMNDSFNACRRCLCSDSGTMMRKFRLSVLVVLWRKQAHAMITFVRFTPRPL